jgi:NADH:ubiquinone oxidoreductase subunit 4 (subunit M)
MLLAEVGLVLVYALVEARVGALSLHTRHGLSDHMPKLARASLLLSLSAAALPGSLDFIAVELLLSGEATHSVLGALLMSSALSALAFGIVRVHFRVFFGPPSLPNARLEGLPRELVGLSLLLAALLAGGLAPSLLPLLRAAP